jgi:hypothetical protein
MQLSPTSSSLMLFHIGASTDDSGWPQAVCAGLAAMCNAECRNNAVPARLTKLVKLGDLASPPTYRFRNAIPKPSAVPLLISPLHLIISDIVLTEDLWERVLRGRCSSGKHETAIDYTNQATRLCAINIPKDSRPISKPSQQQRSLDMMTSSGLFEHELKSTVEQRRKKPGQRDFA